MKEIPDTWESVDWTSSSVCLITAMSVELALKGQRLFFHL